jgi:hypothetical protein
VSSKEANSEATNSKSTAQLLEDKKKLRSLIDRAQDGDKAALPELRRMLDEDPTIARFVDLARTVERSIVEKMSGDDVFTQEAIPRNIKVIRERS